MGRRKHEEIEILWEIWIPWRHHCPTVTEHANTLTLDCWGIYEMDFPEGPNMKAPWGSLISIWGLFFNSWKLSSIKLLRSQSLPGFCLLFHSVIHKPYRPYALTLCRCKGGRPGKNLFWRCLQSQIGVGHLKGQPQYIMVLLPPWSIRFDPPGKVKSHS